MADTYWVGGVEYRNGVPVDQPVTGFNPTYDVGGSLMYQGRQAGVIGSPWSQSSPPASPAPQGGTGGGAGGGGAAATNPYDAYRTSAFNTLTQMFRQWGIDVDGSGLAAQVKSWVWEDKSADEIGMLIRNTDAYNKRFTGMADLIKRGQYMTESEYIALERSYRSTMVQWGLPSGFYDSYDDYGRFIANGVSVAELDDRIASAKSFIDSADPSYKTALKNLYGIDEGGMMAYVLDGDKAQAVLQKQFKAAAFAGAANANGFDLSKDQAEQYGGTLGAQYDRMGANQLGVLSQQLSGLGDIADNQANLAYIDKEAYSKTDTLDAEVLSDRTKKAASARRAEREKARFGGTSAYGAGSLARVSGA